MEAWTEEEVKSVNPNARVVSILYEAYPLLSLIEYSIVALLSRFGVSYL